MLVINNIFIKSKKVFFEYFIIYFLKQKVNLFDLFIFEKKLKVIAKI